MLKHRPLTLCYPEQTDELFFFSTVCSTAERLYLYNRVDLVTENSRLLVGFYKKKIGCTICRSMLPGYALVTHKHTQKPH